MAMALVVAMKICIIIALRVSRWLSIIKSFQGVALYPGIYRNETLDKIGADLKHMKCVDICLDFFNFSNSLMIKIKYQFLEVCVSIKLKKEHTQQLVE